MNSTLNFTKHKQNWNIYMVNLCLVTFKKYRKIFTGLYHGHVFKDKTIQQTMEAQQIVIYQGSLIV